MCWSFFFCLLCKNACVVCTFLCCALSVHVRSWYTSSRGNGNVILTRPRGRHSEVILPNLCLNYSIDQKSSPHSLLSAPLTQRFCTEQPPAQTCLLSFIISIFWAINKKKLIPSICHTPILCLLFLCFWLDLIKAWLLTRSTPLDGFLTSSLDRSISSSQTNHTMPR